MSKSQFQKKRKEKKRKKGEKEIKSPPPQNSAWLWLRSSWYSVTLASMRGYEMRVPRLEQMEVVPMEVSMDLLAVDLTQCV